MNGQPCSEIFTIQARKCKRCGVLLTSAETIRDGYGECCRRKMRQEDLAMDEAKNQCSLFDKKDEVACQTGSSKKVSAPATR